LKNFRNSHRRMLRDALLAGAIAAAAAGAPHGAYAHGHIVSKPASAKVANAKKEIAAVSRGDREQRRATRTKLFASHPLRGSRALGGQTGDGGTSGIASVYSDSRTASGEAMISGGMTAAHRSLPFGTQVTVVNKNNGRSVVVRINDRGPFVRGRVIDLSPAAARALGVNGLASVSLSVVRRAERHAEAEDQSDRSVAAGDGGTVHGDHDVADHDIADHVGAVQAAKDQQAKSQQADAR
jgi:peptidoglycan lytic transglycosylase